MRLLRNAGREYLKKIIICCSTDLGKITFTDGESSNIGRVSCLNPAENRKKIKMNKLCAKCSKTVYPMEELKCLDRVKILGS